MIRILIVEDEDPKPGGRRDDGGGVRSIIGLCCLKYVRAYVV